MLRGMIKLIGVELFYKNKITWNFSKKRIELGTFYFFYGLLIRTDRACGNRWHQNWHCTWDTCVAVSRSVCVSNRNKTRGNIW